MLLLTLVVLLFPRAVMAERPVIPPGREDEILALLDPHKLGDELAPGWTLHSFSIDSGTIHFWVAGPDGAFAQLSLDHPEHAPPNSRQLEGFALAIVGEPAGSEAAVAELTATIERNDDGDFWKRDVFYADEARQYPYREMGLLLLRNWAKDGLLLGCVFALVLAALLRHTLKDTEPWMKWALLAIVVAGVLVRLLLSPRIALEAWPYSRFVITARMIFRGPGLAFLHPEPVYATETIVDSTLVLAMLAPPAIYVHARYLLDDRRAALIAAGIIAFLPMHVRFSYTDVAFIPSVAISAMLFTLTYVAARDPSKVLGWFAVASVGFPLALVFLLRPLNILHYALLMSVPWVNHGIYTEKLAPNWPRVIVAFSIMTLVTVFGGIPWLLEEFGDQVREGLSFKTLTTAVEVLLSPRMNTLINPVMTPPGLTVLAVLGSIDLWRRGKRRLFGFLILWLLGGLVGHAYVFPESAYMQARYHLHLIVPFLMLAACGFEFVLRWLAANRERKKAAGEPDLGPEAQRRVSERAQAQPSTIRVWLDSVKEAVGGRYRAAVALLVGYVCASPLLHQHFIRNVQFNDMQEWLFVHSLREEIPAQCEVIEYVGWGSGSRFERVGTFVEHGVERSRWVVHSIPAPQPGEPEIPEEIRALLHNPPECLYWYEGMPCFGNKQLEEQKAAVCDAIEGFVRLEEVASTSFESRIYDENLARGLGEDVEQIELKLFRAQPKQ